MKRLCLCCGLYACLVSQTVSQIARPQAAISQNPTSDEKLHTPKIPAFDVVSIRQIENPNPGNFLGAEPQAGPDGYRSKAQSLWATIMLAYYQTSRSPLYWRRTMLMGAPPWLMKNQYAIDARIAPEDLQTWQQADPGRIMLRSALQQMLRDRCKLLLHRTTTEQSVYGLVIRHGAKLMLKEADGGEVFPKGASHIPYDGGVKSLDKGSIGFYNISMNYFIAFLTAYGSDRPVVDMTGLEGRYDFVLRRLQRDGNDPSDASPWDLESIGLSLKPTKAPLEALVIDHVEEPSAN